MTAICSKPIILASFERAIDFHFSQCSRQNKTICADVAWNFPLKCVRRIRRRAASVSFHLSIKLWIDNIEIYWGKSACTVVGQWTSCRNLTNRFFPRFFFISLSLSPPFPVHSGIFVNNALARARPRKKKCIPTVASDKNSCMLIDKCHQVNTTHFIRKFIAAKNKLHLTYTYTYRKPNGLRLFFSVSFRS